MRAAELVPPPASRAGSGVRTRLAAVLLLIVLLVALVTPAVHAADAAGTSDDPALEARVMRLSAELRCLVCQNQTIADSHAELAVDLRNQVREMLRAGRSDREVLDYMTARYGDFVLYRPPLRPTTAPLWFGPLALLAVGAAVLFVVLRRRQRLGADQFEPDTDGDGLADDPVATPRAPRAPTS
jgi:cytochrome c-type biogenesis protein CcmH